MESGRIVEQGNHEQLLDAEGAYARLYNAQFAGSIIEEEAAKPAAIGGPAGGLIKR